MSPVYSGDLDTAPDTEGISGTGASWGERWRAGLSETFENLPLVSSIRTGELASAAGDVPSWGDPDVAMQEQVAQSQRPPIPEISTADARAKVKSAGLENSLTLPDQASIKQPVLDLMIVHAQEERERETTIARGPQGFIPGALDVGTSFLVGALDPMNIAAFSIPVLGEARYAKLLASAGESVIGRAAVRGGVGTLQGAAGSAILTPLDYYTHTQDGQDYTMSEALENIIMSAGTGGFMHATGIPLNVREGIFGEAYRAARGRPLVEAAKGQENVPGGASVSSTEIPTHEASEQTVAANAVAEQKAVKGSQLMASVSDLPPQAKEDVMHGAVANLIEGEPVRVGEMLDSASGNDPRIAESFNEAPYIPSDEEVRKVIEGGGIFSADTTDDLVKRTVVARPKTQSLLEFLRGLGGLKPDPELNAIFGGTKLDLIRKDGLTLDRAREAAVEAGYIHDVADEGGGVTQSTIQHLLDGMDAEARGNKIYPAGEEGPKARDYALEKINSDITAGFQELGQDAKTVPKKIRDRMAHIMYTEGVEDPVTAYERAVMEADYYAEKAGTVQRITENKLPAETNRLSAQPTAAPAAGGADTAGRGAGGVSAAARQSGSNDSRTAEWNRLANASHNDAAIEQSQAAAKLPEPFSTIATKATEAAQKAAAEIEERFRAAAEGGMIPEQAKAEIDAIILKAKQYEVDWAAAVKNGISCLAAGAAEAVV